VDEKICREFDVERGEAMQDAEALVRGLADHGILQISNEPFGAPDVPGLVER